MGDRLLEDVAAVGRIDAVPAILEIICQVTGMGFAAVARVTEDRWIACAVHDRIGFGLKVGEELLQETTICSAIRDSGRGVFIDNVSESVAYRTHPTPAKYGFQSYVSVPIFRADHSFFGTLCALDPKPAHVSREEVVNLFRLFSELLSFHLEAQERLAASETALTGERETADLREQFIAILGHDLRNPLAAIDAGARLLQDGAPPQKATALIAMVQGSVRRMGELIDNMLDLARGRMGGGFTVTRAMDGALAEALEHVLGELRAAWPERRIESAFALEAPVFCDRARIAQLLSNLVSNALTHGAPDAPVQVTGGVADGAFVLAVINKGPAIPPATQRRLFQPFFRGASPASREGLGLGLYIAAEIARAHGGALVVQSGEGETRFIFTMPLTYM